MRRREKPFEGHEINWDHYETRRTARQEMRQGDRALFHFIKPEVAPVRGKIPFWVWVVVVMVFSYAVFR